jgi:hypothetical protein
MDNTGRTNNGVVALTAALAAAVAVSLGVASALAAPPLKNGERMCTKICGTFAGSASQYTCTGTDSARKRLHAEADFREVPVGRRHPERHDHRE